jgi:hypothetical protein
MDIAQIKDRALRFMQELDARKTALAPSFTWYPYTSLSNFIHLDTLLTEENRALLRLIGDNPAHATTVPIGTLGTCAWEGFRSVKNQEAKKRVARIARLIEAKPENLFALPRIV